MRDQDRRMPTTNQPLNARRRRTGGPLVITLLLLVLILGIFVVLTLTSGAPQAPTS